MEYIKKEMIVTNTIGKIVCCECGESIAPNPVNMCTRCISTSFDIGQDIPRVEFVDLCTKCERYLEPPSKWIPAVLESKELLRICLKKIKLHGVILQDSHFLWTEPHSRRLMVEITVTKEIANECFAKQTLQIEFVVNKHMCGDCHKVEAKDFWTAKVQVRQKSDHKRTIFYLEQIILKNNAMEKVSSLSTMEGGIDFFFSTDQHANNFTSFIASVIPCKISKSKKLKSHDIHSGIYNYKITTLINIVPICKDNVVCLPPKVANQLGQISQICVVLKVENTIILIDPQTAQVGTLDSTTYWRNEMQSICVSRNLQEYIIIEIESSANIEQKPRFKGKKSKKHKVMDVWVQKESELGSGDLIFARTHVGGILKEGDTVLGFDVKNSNVNDDNFEKLQPDNIPELIIVKKKTKTRKRKFRLNHIGINDDNISQNEEYMDFLDDLEDDPELKDKFITYSTGDDISTEPKADIDEFFDATDDLENEIERNLNISDTQKENK